MAQQIIDVGAAPDDGQGDTLREGFIKTNDNFTEIYTSGLVGSNVRIANNTITTTVINSDLLLSPNGIGKLKIQSAFVPTYNNVYDLGSPDLRFSTGYVGTGGIDVLGTSIFRGNVEITNLIANNVSISNVTVTNATVLGNSILGNTATANYFIGDGGLLSNVRVEAPTSINNGTSNINIAVANGNILVTAAGTQQWMFGTDGTLTLPDNRGIKSATNIDISIDTPDSSTFTWQFGEEGTLTAPGNITTTANISGAYILGNGSQLTGIDATSIQNGTSNVRVAASGNVTFGIGGTGNVVVVSTQGIAVNNTRITGLAEPEQNQDAATKNYVDSVAQGLDPKASVNVSTTTALGSYTYNNGSAGVGATITGTATGVLTIDGQAVVLNDRVLVKNEPSAGGLDAYNGIYLCTTAGAVGVAYVLTRSTDFNQPSEMYSAFTFTETGTYNADTGWVCTNNSATPITIGTTPILFTQFSGAGSYTANTSAGLLLSGTVFSAKVDNITTAFDGTGNIVVKASANLTTPNIGAATGTSLSVTGNITGNNVNIGNNLSVLGDAVITGNLTVDGTATYINIESLEVQDPIIGLGRGPNNTPLTTNDGKDRGTRLWYYSTSEQSAFVGFDNSQQKLIAATNVSITNEIVTVQDYGTIDVGNVAAVGNISANYVIGNGTVLTSVMTDRGYDQNNYDTLTQMGVYTVNRVSWGGVTGAPTDSMVTVGLLEVKTSTNSTTVQSFFPGTITEDVKIQFDRTLWAGVWTPWVRLTSNGQQIEGGSY